jgi:hypothetical protein
MEDPGQWTDKLAMNLEAHESGMGDYHANLYRAWFTPPATGNYRFHVSCNDHCDLRFGNTPGQSIEVTELLNVDHWQHYRRMSWST